MNILINDIAGLIAFTKNPVRFLKNISNLNSFYSTLRRWILLMIVLTGILALVTIINYDEFSDVNRAQMEALFTNPNMRIEPSVWRNVILLPLLGFCFVLMTGLGRHIMIKLLGEQNTSLAKTQSLTIYTMLPVIVVLAISAMIRILWPEMPIPGKPFNISGREIFLNLILVSSILFEMILCIKTLKVLYNQQTGRAILTYFSPMILCNISGIGFGALLFIFLMGGSAYSG